MPKPKKEQITIRVLPQTIGAINELADRNGITKGDALDLLVLSGLAKRMSRPIAEGAHSMSQIAEPGTSITIKPDESWTCSCGKEQGSPGAWVAAKQQQRENYHFSASVELTHTCQECGVLRKLSRGVLTTPPARNIDHLMEPPCST